MPSLSALKQHLIDGPRNDRETWLLIIVFTTTMLVTAASFTTDYTRLIAPPGVFIGGVLGLAWQFYWSPAAENSAPIDALPFLMGVGGSITFSAVFGFDMLTDTPLTALEEALLFILALIFVLYTSVWYIHAARYNVLPAGMPNVLPDESRDF